MHAIQFIIQTLSQQKIAALYSAAELEKRDLCLFEQTEAK